MRSPRERFILVIIAVLAAVLICYHITPSELALALRTPPVPYKNISFRKVLIQSTKNTIQASSERVNNSLLASALNGNTTGRNQTRQRLPQCIIIGVRKGGTRALLDYISLHPYVKTPGKEMHFFDKNYSLGLDWYKSKLPYTEPHEITIEKTPKYFVTPEAPERIYRMNSSIKLILITRDPVERVISDFLQTHRREILSGAEPKDKFEDFAIDKTTGKVNYLWHAVQTSIYHKHFVRWLKYFPMKQILVLDSKTFTMNPLKDLKKVETFLNLKPMITADMFYFNKTKGFFCRKLPEGCLGRSKGFHHPDVNHKIIDKLRAFFKPHNWLFYHIVGHDFKWS